MTVSVSPKRTALIAAARERILVLDGAMGTMIQGLEYDEAAFRGERFRDFHRDVRGNNDLLILTRAMGESSTRVSCLHKQMPFVSSWSEVRTNTSDFRTDTSDFRIGPFGPP